MPPRWEVDPESKSKLTTLQSLPPNRHCIDCHAPSPQWASPKFGTFICLTCAGLHRSLGVHISFVRSVAMDSFKTSEVERMEKGGNGKWKDFWESHAASNNKGGAAGAGGSSKWEFPGKGGDEAAKRKIEATYGGEVGEEYKERLSCLVEGREFTGVPKVQKKKTDLEPTMSGSSSSLAGLASTGSGGSAGGGAGPKTQKQQNEDFFNRKGAENANRPDNLRPSEGGKYGGFGSAPPDPQSGNGGSGGSTGGGAMPGVDDFQKDPLAAVSKGWGWFSSQATKVGKGVYEGGVFAGQKIAEADLAAQARSAAAAASKGIQTGTKATADRFNNFVENEGGNNTGAGRVGGASGNSSTARGGGGPEKKDFWDTFGDKHVEPPAEKKDFWDSFGVGGDGEGSGSIGTAAMKKSSAESGLGSTTNGKAKGTGAAKEGGKGGEWEKWD